MTFQSSSLLLIRLIPDCVQYERLWKLVSRQQISKLSIFNTFTVFDNFQLSTFNNFQHSTTFNFDNLVSNMQFQFSVLELETYRNLEVENFRLLTLKTFTFVVWGFNFEILTLKSEDSSLKIFTFALWSFKFEVYHFRFLSLSRRRPSLRVAGQATDISPLAFAFIPADCAQQRR